MEIKDRLRYEKKCGAKQWWIDITDFAKSIFGDIFEKVEVSGFYDCSEERAVEEARIFIENQEKHIKDGLGISFDGEQMRITFTNGKKIEIWNSEWGGIRVP